MYYTKGLALRKYWHVFMGAKWTICEIKVILIYWLIIMVKKDIKKMNLKYPCNKGILLTFFTAGTVFLSSIRCFFGNELFAVASLLT